MTYYHTLTTSIPGRDARPRPQTPAARIAWLDRWLETNSHMSWTEGYKAKAAEKARLEAGE